MKIGFYKSCITPSIGTSMAGYAARRDVSKGVHDDLYARAIGIDDGNDKWVIVSLDLARIDRPLRNRIADYVSRKTDIDKKNIIICATHTHSGPDIGGYFSEYDEYLFEFTVRKVAGTILASLENMFEVEIKYNRGFIEGISINRRAPLTAPIDPEVYAILFKGGNKSIVLSNFTCHPTILSSKNLFFSADYPGELNKYVEYLLNSHSIFFNGTAGDINPLTPSTKIISGKYNRGLGTFLEVEWMGKILACEVVKNILLSREEKIDITYTSNRISVKTLLPNNLISAKILLDDAKNALNEALERNDFGMEMKARLDLWRARRIIRLYKIYGYDTMDIEIKVLGFNKNLSLVFLPGEVLVELGLKIKKKSPFKNTIIIGYSNEYPGYIPSLKAYERNGYETMYPACVLKKGEGEKIAEKTIEILCDLADKY